MLDRLGSPTPALGAVDVRLVTPSPSIPASEGEPAPSSTPWPTLALPTEHPAPTVVVPTSPVFAGPTPGAAIIGTPSPSGTSALTPGTTGSLETITPTPTAAPYLYLPVGAPTMAVDRGCALGAVFGYVFDERGEPLSGIQLRVYDPWNHNFPTITKQPPDTGYYDVILGTGPATYFVVVVDSLGNQVAPVVQVDHKEGSPGCWYRVDFRRTRAR